MRRFRYLFVSIGSPGNSAARRRTGRSTRAVASRLISALAVMTLTACVGNSARFSPMPGKAFPPKDESFEVAVFDSALPSRSFERIARIDVQMEMAASQEVSLQAAIPELKRQARLAGADAIIDIRLQRSKTGEVTVFQVSAMGIRYSQN
jgi:hypothetical protein